MISGAINRLKIPAALTRDDRFTCWIRATNSFSNTFRARQYVADRFKTIYHRPTRRETLSLDPDMTIPTSLVVRHEATNIVYAMTSVDRYDSSHDKAYDNARAVHKVYAGEVFREVTQGTGDNLGPLVRASEGILYADLELRTEENYPDAHREQYGNYFMTTPDDPDLQLQDGDYFVFSAGPYSGLEFRVREVYAEAGFQLSRVESRAKNVESLTYKLITAAGSYNSTTGVVTEPTVEDRIFSGVVEQAEVDASTPPLIGKDLKIFVAVDHVGFSFQPEGKIVRGSDTYEIRETAIGADGLQWVLTVERVP